MRIVKPGYEILTELPENPVDFIKIIERAARVCYKSEGLIKEDGSSAEKMVRGLIKSNHTAMLEHQSLSVLFTVDRGVSHEAVRHRLASFAQESTRYCVAGDMLLSCINPHLHLTVKDLFDNVCKSKNGAWKRIKIRQLNEDTGEIIYSKIKNVFYLGKKPCIELKTKLGYSIVCTKDHLIRVKGGYICAGEFSIGENIYVNGTKSLYQNYEWLYNQNITLNKTFKQIAKEYGFNYNTVKCWGRKLGIPKKGTGYFNVGRIPWNKGIQDPRQVKTLLEYHFNKGDIPGPRKENLVKYQIYTDSECAICGDVDTLQVHHIDEDRSNNYPDNLITLCSSCHRQLHAKSLLVPYCDTIIDIIDAGSIDVYDIEMASSYHNFVANGVIVHNCSYNGDKFDNQIAVIDISGGLGLDPKAANMDHEKFQLILDIWEEAMIRAEDSYMKLLNIGCSPQIARSVLPNSLKTEIVVTANLREWRHIFSLRACDTTGPAHPQIKEVMVPLLKELATKIPVVFDDLVDLLPKE